MEGSLYIELGSIFFLNNIVFEFVNSSVFCSQNRINNVFSRVDDSRKGFIVSCSCLDVYGWLIVDCYKWIGGWCVGVFGTTGFLVVAALSVLIWNSSDKDKKFNQHNFTPVNYDVFYIFIFVWL